MTPSVAILIPTKNRPAALQQTVPAALATGAPVVVCDQSAHTTAVPDAVEYLHAPQLSGLPAARNHLLTAVPWADIALFIDDDTTVAANLATQLAALAAAETEVSAWGPVLETRPRSRQRAHRLSQMGCFHDPRRLQAGPSDRSTCALFGACFAVRRQHAIAVGGFDESRSGYALGEDFDFCLRLAKAGYRLRFSADLRAEHRCDIDQRANREQRGRAKAEFLRWLARRHGQGNPATLLHLALALVAAASGRGQEPASARGVWQGLTR